MTSTELLPCPFCAAEGKNFVDVVSITENYYRVKCFVCGAMCGPTETVEDAAAAWNRREDPGELPY